MLKKLLYLLLMIASAAAGFFLNKAGFDRIEALRKIERIPRCTVAALIPGEANISGTAMVKDGQILKGPDSGSPCLYYKYTIEKETKDSEGKTRWETTHSETRFVPFTLTDKTGTITIYPVAAGTVSLAEKHRRTSGDMRYTEYRLDPGMTVFAMGMAQWGKSGISLVFDAPGTYIPILSVRTEEQERGTVGLVSLLCTVGGLVLISLAVYFLTRMIALHQTLAYLSIVAAAIAASLMFQSHKMIQNDLRSAFLRLEHERTVRQNEAAALLRSSGISWDGDWMKLDTLLKQTQSKLTAVQKEKLQAHRINLARSILRTERIRQGFPENLIAASMGLTEPMMFTLSTEEENILKELESTFIPSRISWIAASIMGGIGLLGAALLGVAGIRRIKTKRWIENIPTVKVKGAVYGINEITGKATMPQDSSPLLGPLSGQPCVAYRYLVKEKRHSGKKTEWVVITDERRQTPFICKDNEGAVAVIPDNSELIFKTSSRKRQGNREYSEKRIPLGSDIYLLGSAVINPETHDSLIIAKGDDPKMPFIISDYSEDVIIASKAAAGFLMVNLGFNFFMLAGFSLAGFKGGFGATSYMTAALTPVIYLLLFMIAVMYNDMIFLRRRCDSMWANIDVALKKRFDLLPQLVNAAKGYLSHESSLNENIAAIRSSAAALTPGQAADRTTAENQTFNQIAGLVEKYPDLKANGLMISLMKRTRDLEDEVALMREGYNHAVEIYNTRIAKIPEIILAKFFKLQPRTFFQA